MTEPVPARHAPPAPSRETWALVHAGLVVFAAAWMFGGRIWWAKPALAWLATPALGLTLWELAARLRQDPRDARPLLLALLPMALLAALTGAAALIPNATPRLFAGQTVLALRDLTPLVPSTADAARTLREAWLLFGLYLVGLNVHACVRSRRRLRRLLVALVANAVVLSIFGTLQKLLGHDLFFGLERAPHAAFFATFVYHNHWGAFAVLALAAGLGLVFHHAARPRGRRFWQSPAPAGIVAALIIAATAPLSSSRSTSLLAGALLAVALVHGLVRIARARIAEGRPWAVSATVIVALSLTFGYTVYRLAERTIDTRVAATREQVADILAQGHVGQRAQLYGDTWRMAAARPWFGWGLETYERIFPYFNSVPRSPVDGLPIYFQEAHSDWLQAAAEIGFVGGALLLAAVAIPLARAGRAWRRHALPRYLLLGCASIAGYAWIEFPMANPAVVAMWWVLFFAGLRHAALSEQR